MFSKFGDYSDKHWLMVMDMQSRYVDHTSVGAEHVRKLILNISKEVERCLCAWWRVLFVEYEEDGETIGAICGYDRRYHEGVVILEKDHNDLLQSSERHRKKAREEMRKIKQQEIFITAIWVNTPECVRRTANSVNDFGIPVNVPVGLTLDLGRYHEVGNEIKTLSWMNWNEGVFYIPKWNEHKKNLVDFL